MNQDIDIYSARPYDIYEYLKKTGNVTFVMSRKEEGLFKKGCKSLDLMYKNMIMRGGLLNKMSKLIAVPALVILVKILNWYRSLGYKSISKALEVYEFSWDNLDFIQVQEKNDRELYVHFFWLKKV